jgi:hypothetical protein
VPVSKPVGFLLLSQRNKDPERGAREMKKQRVATLVAAMAVAASLVVSPATASADPAIVIHKAPEVFCAMPGSDAQGSIIFGGLGQPWHVVENANNVILRCRGENITNLSGRGQSFRGFECGLGLPSGGFALATDTYATIAPNGQASLTCIFTKQ